MTSSTVTFHKRSSCFSILRINRPISCATKDFLSRNRSLSNVARIFVFLCFLVFFFFFIRVGAHETRKGKEENAFEVAYIFEMRGRPCNGARREGLPTKKKFLLSKYLLRAQIVAGTRTRERKREREFEREREREKEWGQDYIILG